MDDKSKVDITNALKNDVTFTGSANEVKKGNTISVKDVTVRSGFDTTTEAEKVLQNYNTGSLNSGKNIGCANTYEVTEIVLPFFTSLAEPVKVTSFFNAFVMSTLLLSSITTFNVMSFFPNS